MGVKKQATPVVAAKPIPLVEVAVALVKMSAIGKDLKDSRLNQRAQLLLIADMTGLGVTTIKKVLDALPLLEKTYLK